MPSVDTANFYKKDAYSDVTIKYGSRQFKAHKLILCSQSEYFTKLFNSQFAEGSQKVVELKDDDEDAVEAMLTWIYTFDYKYAPKPGRSSAPSEAFAFEVMACITADKYQLKALADVSKKHAEDIMTRCTAADLTSIMEGMSSSEVVYPERMVGVITAARKRRIMTLLYDPRFLTMVVEDGKLGMEIALLLRPCQGAQETDYVTCRCGLPCTCAKGHFTSAWCPACGGFLSGLGAQVKTCWMVSK